MVKRSLAFLMGLTLAAAAGPALAASLSATPAATSLDPGGSTTVDVTLSLGSGEQASVFDGRIAAQGAASVSVVSAGPTWPNASTNVIGSDTAALSLTSNNAGGDRLLATLSVVAGAPGSVISIIVDQGSFAQFDLDEPPFIGDLSIDNLGQVLATIEVVPEPGTVLLLGLGLTSLAFYGRRRTAAE